MSVKYELINLGEIRFGPQYFSLSINGKIINDRIFGDEEYQTKDSKYLVFQEWLTIDYGTGPITRPFIINVSNFSYYELSNGKKGFSENFKIESGILIYEQIDKGSGISRQFESSLNDLGFKSLHELL